MSPLLIARAEDVLRNAYFRMPRNLKGTPLWSFVSLMTNYGSGFSQQVCRELGWDPDMKCGQRLPERKWPQPPAPIKRDES